MQPLAGGAVNTHWRLVAGGATYVLRRYLRRNAGSDTAYEHSLLTSLAQLGWPVAPPVPLADGTTLLHMAADRWSLFEFMTGKPADSAVGTALKQGAALALLHAAGRTWAAEQEARSSASLSQRQGFGRVGDLDVYIRPEGYASVTELLAWYDRTDRERSRSLAARLESSGERLDPGGLGGLTDTVVHWDFSGANLLWRGGRLSAILDFDFAHVDARVADVARSLLHGFLAQKGGLPAVDAYAWVGDWIQGYCAHAWPPLAEAELAAVPDLMLASELWNTVLPLSIYSRGGPDWMRGSVVGSIDWRLGQIESARPELAATVAAGAARAGADEPLGPQVAFDARSAILYNRRDKLGDNQGVAP